MKFGSFTAAALLLMRVAPAAERPEQTVSLRVQAEQRVSEFERSRFEQELVGRLSGNKCLVRLAPENEPGASLTLTLRLIRWRESDIPGGEPVLDPATGRERPGHLREVVVRFSLRLEIAGRDRPFYEQEREFHVTQGTARVSGFDPKEGAHRQVVDLIADEALHRLCKAAKAAAR